MTHGTIEEVREFKSVDEEVVTHPNIFRKGNTLLVEARIIIILEVDGVEYEYNKVRKFRLTKNKEGG